MTLGNYICLAALELLIFYGALLLAHARGAKMANNARDEADRAHARTVRDCELRELQALREMRLQDAENRQTDAIEALIAHAARTVPMLDNIESGYQEARNFFAGRQIGMSLRLEAQEQLIESHRQRLCHLETEFQRRVGAL